MVPGPGSVFNSESPANTGGGSLGYNEMLRSLSPTKNRALGLPSFCLSGGNSRVLRNVAETMKDYANEVAGHPQRVDVGAYLSDAEFIATAELQSTLHVHAARTLIKKTSRRIRTIIKINFAFRE
jgi:hypothetical protein